MVAKTAHEATLAPDRRPLTKSQAKRLAALTDFKADEVVGQTVADLQAKYPWRVDPQLFLFRRICGRVVRKDPLTGVEYPVPFATVHVEDTDCHLIAYFPKPHPWGWYFPFGCHREQIGTVKTDQCGNFCVWIPRFDIDWILRWRRKHVCFPYIFVKPSLIDILKYLVEEKVPPFPPHGPGPGPDPDPGPLLQQAGPEVMRRAAELVGAPMAAQLDLLRANAAFGRDTKAHDQVLSAPAFARPIAPPLPPEFQLPSKVSAETGDANTAVRATLATTLHMKDAALKDLRLDHYIGPFWRCFDIFVPEWTALHDVPDITFRVTQDVNGDGTEETIYSEGYFDVRWNDTTTTDVTLYASGIALTSTVCEAPVVPCGNVPEILYAGLMPLTNPPAPTDPYLDNGTGYARRPNRPHPAGDFVDPAPHPLATAPFCSTLQLYGCTRIPSAAFYRVRRNKGSGSMVPFVGLTWPLNRAIGGPPWQIWPVSDASGWYPIPNPADNWFPPDLLLEWPTGEDGLFTLDVQVANAAKTVLATSSPVRLRIDNTYPTAQFTGLRWRVSGGAWHVLPLACPVIGRGAVPNDIEVEVDYTVLAQHLRSVELGAYGCGGGAMARLSALSTVQHWHMGPADNAVAQTARFSLSHSASAGSYGFSIDARSRAFNPSGGDGGHLADWHYDPTYIWVTPQINIAIVNA
jgi:hypothetical protein